MAKVDLDGTRIHNLGFALPRRAARYHCATRPISTLVNARKIKLISSKLRFTSVVLPFDCKTWDVYKQNCKVILAVYLSTYKMLYISF